MPPSPQPERRYRFPRRMRLARSRQFEAVYKAGARTAVGPLLVWAAPNDVGHCRLGLAVSRRAGKATVRNRIRRLIRESFRLLQHDLPPLPGGYDVVVGAHPHDAMALERYQGMLLEALRRLERRWSNRNDTSSPGA